MLSHFRLYEKTRAIKCHVIKTHYLHMDDLKNTQNNVEGDIEWTNLSFFLFRISFHTSLKIQFFWTLKKPLEYKTWHLIKGAV